MSSFQDVMKSIHPKQLFLIDGLGALLSAFLLGVVLVRFENKIGISHEVFYFLAAIACVFSMYSLLCFVSKLDNWQLYMRIIGIANVLYCCLTMGVMMYLYPKITIVGWLYFGLEMIIVASLALIELKTAAK